MKRNKLDYELLISLKEKGNSYKEIVEITKYPKNSVYGFFIRNFGKLEDRNKSRRQIIDISQLQKEIIFGLLMGDGSIQKVINSYQSRTNHSLKQIEYVKYLVGKLNNLTYGLKISESKNSIKYPQCYFCLKPNENLKEFYDMFYIDKIKKIPDDLSLLTPLAMSIWFMDDGTASGRCSISIATCCFAIDDLNRLSNYLKLKYDINTVVRKDKRLYFNANGGRKFKELVNDYIIDEMKYKFKYIK